MLRIKPYLTICLFWLLAAPAAWASFLDTDPHCRDYGCVVFSDGVNFEIYDVYDIANDTCCVPVGSRLIPRSSQFGDLNFTGTLDSALPPTDEQSILMGITEDGSTVSTAFFDDGSGFLDAGDSLSAFTLTSNTDVILDTSGRSYSHSFFISSRNTKFSLRAAATKSASIGDLGNAVDLIDIAFTPSLSQKGIDGTFEFGKNANGGGIKISNSINTLDDLAGVPVEILDVKRKAGIRKKNGDIDTQSIRMDFLYQIPDYDMSMGTGSLIVDVNFEVFRE